MPTVGALIDAFVNAYDSRARDAFDGIATSLKEEPEEISSEDLHRVLAMQTKTYDWALYTGADTGPMEMETGESTLDVEPLKKLAAAELDRREDAVRTAELGISPLEWGARKLEANRTAIVDEVLEQVLASRRSEAATDPGSAQYFVNSLMGRVIGQLVNRFHVEHQTIAKRAVRKVDRIGSDYLKEHLNELPAGWKTDVDVLRPVARELTNRAIDAYIDALRTGAQGT